MARSRKKITPDINGMSAKQLKRRKPINTDTLVKIEPLTPAPMMLLNKDIQRLLELIPVTKSTEVEQVEYNRRFHNDNNHAELFRGAFLTVDELPLGKYWLDAVNDFNVSIENTEKLRRKISQFENRGVIVGFDLEPFNEQEWTILHFGMGRKPLHYDRLAARYKRDEIKETLSKRQNDISHLVDKMPPHKLYLEKLLQYLKSKYEHA
jgi:tryptophan halogenase